MVDRSHKSVSCSRELRNDEKPRRITRIVGGAGPTGRWLEVLARLLHRGRALLELLALLLKPFLGDRELVLRLAQLRLLCTTQPSAQDAGPAIERRFTASDHTQSTMPCLGNADADC